MTLITKRDIRLIAKKTPDAELIGAVINDLLKIQDGVVKGALLKDVSKDASAFMEINIEELLLRIERK